MVIIQIYLLVATRVYVLPLGDDIIKYKPSFAHEPESHAGIAVEVPLASAP